MNTNTCTRAGHETSQGALGPTAPRRKPKPQGKNGFETPVVYPHVEYYKAAMILNDHTTPSSPIRCEAKEKCTAEAVTYTIPSL